MKKRFWLGLLFLCGGLVYGADTKLEDMAEDTSPTSDDIIYVVDDPAGTPADKKVTFANVQQLVAPVLTENTTVNFTSGMTAAEMQALIDAVPKNINGYNLYFDFGDGTYNTSMTSALEFYYFYNGSISIRGNTGESGLHTNQAVALDFSAGTSSGLDIRYCQHVLVSNLKITVSDTNFATCVYGRYNTYVVVRGCYLIGAGKSNAPMGIRASFGGDLYAEDNYVNNLEYGFYTTDIAKLFSDVNDDTGTSPNYGLSAISGSTIIKSSTQPAGSTSNEATATGGEIR